MSTRKKAGPQPELDEELVRDLIEAQEPQGRVKQNSLVIQGDDVQGAIAAWKVAEKEALAQGLALAGGGKVSASAWNGWGREKQGDDALSVEQRSQRIELNLASASTLRTEVRQAQPVDVHVKAMPPKHPTPGYRTAVLLPDAQRPTVDHSAVDLTLQILADLQRTCGVDEVIHLGDEIDAPDWSVHRSAPDALGRVQEAFDDQHRIFSIERAMCPAARIRWILGNHEARLTNWLVDHAQSLIGLRRANQPVEEPVLSMEFLTRTDEVAVEVVGPYPEGEIWLSSVLRVIHGTVVKGARGATAAAYLAQGDHSTFCGHIHRQELVAATKNTFKGPRTYMAGSPGTLCRLDGAVPSSRSGINARGKQGMKGYEAWEQGMMIIGFEPDGREYYNVEMVTMWNGWCVFRGKHYYARVTPDGTPLDLTVSERVRASFG